MKHAAMTLAFGTLMLCWLSGPATAARAPAAGANETVLAALDEKLQAAKTPQQMQAAYAQALDALMPDIGDDAQRRAQAEKTIEVFSLDAGRPGAEAQRLAASSAIAAKLPSASPLAKVWLVRMLQHIGKAEAVAALVPLMDDKDAAVRDAARRALQANPSDEALAALRTALAKADTPAWRVAIINAIAARKDAASVGPIAKALADKDESVALAAAAALGKIGGQEAAAALAAARTSVPEKVKPVVLDSWLLCADQFLQAGNKDAAAQIYQAVAAKDQPERFRVAAIRGLVRAKGEAAVAVLAEVLTGTDEKLQTLVVPFVQDIPGVEATKSLAALVPRLSPPIQAALLTELGARGDAAAKPAILAATKSKDDVVRSAAWKALGGVGDATDAMVLAQAAATMSDGIERETARAALAILKDPATTQAMTAALEKGEPAVRAELIRGLAARRAAEATPALLKAAADADATIRLAALAALESVADEKALGPLIDILTKSDKDDQRDAASKAVSAVCGRASNKEAAAETVVKAVAGATGPARLALLQALSKVGGQKALDTARAALKDTDPAVRETAIRTLADWPEAAAADDLLAIAKIEAKQNLQVVALRGFVRLVGVGDRKVEDKVRMYAEAMAAARRPEDKRMVLGPLAECTTLEALKLAAPLLDEAPLKEEAANTVTKIARGLGGRLPPEVKDAMEKVVSLTKNEKVRRDAESVLKKIDGQTKK